MKTIEIISNGQPVQFTTKSVTIADREYVYSHITELRHSEAKRIYGFKCDGEVVMLPYEEKDGKLLKAIFAQVQQMHEKPAAKAAPVSNTVQSPAGQEPAKAEDADADTDAPQAASDALQAEAEVPQDVAAADAPAAEDVPAPVEDAACNEDAPAADDTPTAECVAAEDISSVEDAPADVPEHDESVTDSAQETAPADAPAFARAEDTATEEAAADEAVSPEIAADTADAPAEASEENAADAPEETPAVLSAKEKKRLEKEQRKADKEAAKREKQAAKAAAAAGGAVTAYAEHTAAVDTPEEKQNRFKKGIIIFLIILAIFALLAVGWYFLFGPASDPQLGPNSNDTTQYNDIDDMINDLEN